MYIMRHRAKMITEVSIVLKFSFRRLFSSLSGMERKNLVTTEVILWDL